MLTGCNICCNIYVVLFKEAGYGVAFEGHLSACLTAGQNDIGEVMVHCSLDHV